MLPVPWYDDIGTLPFNIPLLLNDCELDSEEVEVIGGLLA